MVLLSLCFPSSSGYHYLKLVIFSLSLIWFTPKKNTLKSLPFLSFSKPESFCNSASSNYDMGPSSLWIIKPIYLIRSIIYWSIGSWVHVIYTDGSRNVVVVPFVYSIGFGNQNVKYLCSHLHQVTYSFSHPLFWGYCGGLTSKPKGILSFLTSTLKNLFNTFGSSCLSLQMSFYLFIYFTSSIFLTDSQISLSILTSHPTST